MAFLKGIMAFFLSLRTAIWLTLAVLAVLFYGSFVMPRHEEFKALHTVPLFPWLAETPLSITWWLFAAIGLLGLLAINTIACSLDSLVRKRGARNFLLIIAPQVIHAGFLFILLAHVLSSYDSFRGMTQVQEGTRLPLPDGTGIAFERINAAVSPDGYITDFSADVALFDAQGRPAGRTTMAPNDPAFFGGVGIYIKTVQPGPVTASALIEVSRDAGAAWALAGGIMSVAGMIILLLLKIRHEDAHD
jgi:cytochrome c biogenesis protein ResB